MASNPLVKLEERLAMAFFAGTSFFDTSSARCHERSAHR